MAHDGPVPSDLLERLTASQPPPEPAFVLATAAAALLLVLLPGVWPLLRHVVTVAHEGGHAVVAVLAGRRLSGIRLHSDTSGLTLSRGRPRGTGMVLTLAAGYPAPALLGLGAATVLTGGRPLVVLWGVLALLALLLVQIRNLFGLWVVLVCGAAVFAVSWWAGPALQQAVAHVLAWFLLLGAVRAVVELARTRRGGRSRTSDPDQLARLTRLPAAVWVLLLGLVVVGCLALGALGLLEPAGLIPALTAAP